MPPSLLLPSFLLPSLVPLPLALLSLALLSLVPLPLEQLLQLLAVSSALLLERPGLSSHL